jgi:flavorubredoxin
MAAVRYYLDEHIAEAVATGLRNRGIDVLTLIAEEMEAEEMQDHVEFL